MMAQTFIDILPALPGYILRMLQIQTVYVSVVFFPLLLMSWAMRKASPRWQIGIWSLLLIRVILPMDLSTSYSAVCLLDKIPAVHLTYQRILDIFHGTSAETDAVTGRDLSRDDRRWAATDMSVSREKQHREFRLNSAQMILFVSWMCCVWVFSAVYLKKYRFYKKIVRHAAPVTDPGIIRIGQDWKKYFNLKQSVHFVSSRHALSPFTMGVFRPVVYLPDDVIRSGDEMLLRSIIGHEIAHIKRNDNVWLKVQNFLQIIYFFHPAIWYANRRIHQARECVCDAMVLGNRGISPETYGQGILSILKLNLFGAEGLCLFSGFGNQKSRMSYRINNLKGEKQMKMRHCIGRYLVLVVFGTLLLPLSGNTLNHSIENEKIVEAIDLDRKATDSINTENDEQSDSSDTDKSNGAVDFISPMKTGRITARYGEMRHPYTKELVFHNGIDIASKTGEIVLAAADGKAISVVTEYEPDNGSGIHAIIRHEGGFQTFYAHLDTVLIEAGQELKAGDEIARVGTTGLSTGPHLHFEIRLNGEPKDPEKYIRFDYVLK